MDRHGTILEKGLGLYIYIYIYVQICTYHTLTLHIYELTLMLGGGGNGYCWVRKPETIVRDRVSTFVREKPSINYIYTYIIHVCVSYSTLCSIKTKEKKKS